MTKVFDPGQFSTMTGGDADLQREIVDLFRGQVPGWRARLMQDDAQDRADAAHTIKGSARAMGLFVLAAACEAAEALPEREQVDGLLEALDEALAALDQWGG
jgi:HPt (histidine-containing phosphotransfer) domain-containing protein